MAGHTDRIDGELPQTAPQHPAVGRDSTLFGNISVEPGIEYDFFRTSPRSAMRCSTIGSPAMSAHDDDMTNLAGRTVAGKYQVDQLIGTGGMGTVWLGHHSALGSRVAIKFIQPKHAQRREARARFEIEARAAARLRSRHAVQVFDYGITDEGLPYLVMEYLEGESLSDALIRRGPLPANEVAYIIRQAARALHAAHSTGIVHRDLKPDNIFLAVDSDAHDEPFPYIVKLVDFGIAKMFEEPVSKHTPSRPMGGPTQEGAVIGTPNFMSPEQLTQGGAPGVLTDVWSLGACAFTAMTARIPFEGDVLGDIVLRVCIDPLPVASQINPRVPPTFDAWFERACARKPDDRFGSAVEMSQALDRALGVGSQLRISDADTEQVQYALRPASAEAIAELEEVEVPNSMSSKTALLAGLVLGVAVMIGLLGALAYKQKLDAEQTPPAPSAPQAP